MRKLSVVFRVVKQTLVREPCIEFVCNAADEAHRNSLVVNAERNAVKAYIRSRISPAGTIMAWLESRGYPALELTVTQRLDYRLRWLDHMIQNLEAEGN